MRDVDTVHPYKLNAKVHDSKQVDKIAKSIQEFGWTGNPIVVNEEGVILAGHGRRLAAIKLGMKEVPVQVILGLSESSQRAYRLADNRVAISNIDTDILQQELAGLSFDLDGIFDKKELDFLVADLGEINQDSFVADLNEAIDAQAEETVKILAAVAQKNIKIENALGFKTISGADERAVAIFMAELQGESGLPPAEAFMEFVRTFSGVPNKSVVTQ